jgi:hypothetical protein
MARLEVLLETTLNQVKGLKDDVERYFDRLSSVQIVEERNRRLEQDLNRISAQCADHQRAMELFKEEQQAKNDKFNRYIYTVSGIVLACSIGWGIVGSYVSSTVSKIMTMVANNQHQIALMQGRSSSANGEDDPPPSSGH